MNLSNCKTCGVLMIGRKSDSCETCQKKKDECYMSVRNYLRIHPSSTLIDVHRETGIALPVLLEIMKSDYAPFAR